eukprot:TRINITY_DN8627_c0_g1_i2.p1 TRINITY_DN8627_c0_g1~~TRINITY_DN8627_c0_g1_i2.p1  ORF type:complete len:235 (-),score=15.02 TRINITY_DN8627_c0_g1_i2:149-796(-)
MDWLFDYPELSARENDQLHFNSGVMVIEPSGATFDLLMQSIETVESVNGGDQGFLNNVFTWWHRLPATVNFLKHIAATEGPERAAEVAYKDSMFLDDPPKIHALHFLGRKPWQCYRDFDCNILWKHRRTFASESAHKRWFQVHDSMPENLQAICLPKNNDKAGMEFQMKKLKKLGEPSHLWNFTKTDPRREKCAPNQKHCDWRGNLKHWVYGGAD